MSYAPKPPSPYADFLVQRPKAASPYTPGQQFLLLESELKGYRLTRAGDLCSLRRITDYEKFFREYKHAPVDVLRHYALTHDAHPELAQGPADVLHNVLRRHLLTTRPTPLFDASLRTEELVAVLARAWRLKPPPLLAGQPVQLRLLVDRATGVSYAELALFPESIVPFLIRATAPGMDTLLQAPPKVLQVAKNLFAKRPEIKTWTTELDIRIEHPAQGDSGGQYVGVWQSDISVMRPQGSDSSGVIRWEQAQHWLKDHAYVLGLSFGASAMRRQLPNIERIARFPGRHHTGATRVDAERFFAETGKGSFSDAVDAYLKENLY